jgi:hypothetical protein
MSEPVSLCVAIYTHSDFFDILSIQLEYFSRHTFDAKICLFSNKPYDSSYETIIYDDSLPYASRLLYCMGQIACSHILIIHENDILLNYEATTIHTLIKAMIEHGIDSLDLKHDYHAQDIVVIDENLAIGKKWEYFFCVQPTIWNKNSLANVLHMFRDRSYRMIEQEDVQKHIRENYRTYICRHKDSLQSIWYRVYKHFCFLHLTSRLLLLPCTDLNGLDPYIQKEHEYIFEKYLRGSDRETQPTAHSFLSHAVKDHRW